MNYQICSTTEEITPTVRRSLINKLVMEERGEASSQAAWDQTLALITMLCHFVTLHTSSPLKEQRLQDSSPAHSCAWPLNIVTRAARSIRLFPESCRWRFSMVRAHKVPGLSPHLPLAIQCPP
jgi:hypothetical protein